MINSIGVIGTGEFGVFLIERIRALSRSFPLYAWDKHAKSTYSLEKAAGCDAVVFAVPPKAYKEAMREIIPLMRKDAVIVDICTVKMHTVELLRELAGGRPYIATHPMFGPQSFIDQSGSLQGLQVVVCESTLPDGWYDALERFLVEKLQLDVVRMTPEEHDEIQAEEQLLTQRFGAVIRRAGFKLNRHNVHTVSARHFYRAMEIVGNNTKLFVQASALNPYWPKVLARYELANAELTLELLNGSEN